jgi:hypothetical protein
MNPTFSRNKQLAHTPFPKKINIPITTIRFIRFVAKISVLNPKVPANDQWPKKTKESVTFFICSPLIDRANKEKVLFLSLHLSFPFLINFFFWENVLILFKINLNSFELWSISYPLIFFLNKEIAKKFLIY